MNKKEICEMLLAAGIAFDGKLPAADLKALAEANDLSTDRVPTPEPPLPPPASAEADAYYAEMQAGKVLAGLPLADAIEVTARQRKEDDAKLPG